MTTESENKQFWIDHEALVRQRIRLNKELLEAEILSEELASLRPTFDLIEHYCLKSTKDRAISVLNERRTITTRALLLYAESKGHPCALKTKRAIVNQVYPIAKAEVEAKKREEVIKKVEDEAQPVTSSNPAAAFALSYDVSDLSSSEEETARPRSAGSDSDGEGEVLRSSLSYSCGMVLTLFAGRKLHIATS